MSEQQNNNNNNNNNVPWPKLTCCYSHDYCNADELSPANENNGGIFIKSTTSKLDKERNQSESNVVDNNSDGWKSSTRPVQPLQIATLLLAIAALISALAACYVVTRYSIFHNCIT